MIPLPHINVPYGFKVIINPKEMKMVALIKQLVDSGKTFRDIADYLTDHGYKPRGSYWHPQSIKNIYNNFKNE